MLSIQLDQQKVEAIFIDELKKKLAELENRCTFWDTNELKRHTCMSWNTIQEKFFHDPRFPKHKIGGKWYFPAKECEEFLLLWLKEQPSY